MGALFSTSCLRRCQLSLFGKSMAAPTTTPASWLPPPDKVRRPTLHRGSGLPSSAGPQQKSRPLVRAKAPDGGIVAYALRSGALVLLSPRASSILGAPASELVGEGLDEFVVAGADALAAGAGPVTVRAAGGGAETVLQLEAVQVNATPRIDFCVAQSQTLPTDRSGVDFSEHMFEEATRASRSSSASSVGSVN